MSLENYEEKRDFGKTSEPAPEPGTKNPEMTGTGKKLIFVMHKHFASHLHFDLRLELDGVLKSWAVPKGPTINPKEKKLAVMVEDHPLDYANFEGVIPDGNYGAGRVYIWDRGTYHFPDIEDGKENEKALRDGLEKGHLTFIMEGKILKGEFSLVRLKKASPKDWLLIKKNDAYASETDVTSIKAEVELEASERSKKKLI
jgi:bifunctional non-homologous end joining protein LigD